MQMRIYFYEDNITLHTLSLLYRQKFAVMSKTGPHVLFIMTFRECCGARKDRSVWSSRIFQKDDPV